MPATEGQILHWISDQVQKDSCLDDQSANDFAAGVLTGYRLGQSVTLEPITDEIRARGLARLAVEADRAESEVA